MSRQARTVLDAGRELWRYYHAQLGANPNASYYDIRLHFQGTTTDAKGRVKMNSDSVDATYTFLIVNLRTAMKDLAKHIELKVYEYGFLKMVEHEIIDSFRNGLTWENFFLNADTNTPVNAQIELFTNGNFITRSNALERIYHRVAYFDWDGDGLENSIDTEPLVAGVDAHGTNAEWHNVVCSNVLDAVSRLIRHIPESTRSFSFV